MVTVPNYYNYSSRSLGYGYATPWSSCVCVNKYWGDGIPRLGRKRRPEGWNISRLFYLHIILEVAWASLLMICFGLSILILGFCRPYRALRWGRVIPGLRHAQARALPRAIISRLSRGSGRNSGLLPSGSDGVRESGSQFFGQSGVLLRA